MSDQPPVSDSDLPTSDGSTKRTEENVRERAQVAYRKRVAASEPINYLDYRMGFEDGWRDESSRPYFCAFCTFEYQGFSDTETLAVITNHIVQCSFHPLVVRIHSLEAALEEQQKAGITNP